ncbi:MAG: efflux RND transporter periplasmic adaptor subunit [Sediminibacterium sp.]|nr:efflux RND transporter periplasmic adaptor subunit [Sediminibacterium sp.]MBX9778723.1 efflux RND transporter periplasmic adaptor subunit [Chitinophagaceae bacterium]
MKYIYILFFSVIIIACKSKTNTSSGDVKKEIIKKSNDSLVTLTAAQRNQAALQIGKPIEAEIQEVIKVNGLVDVPPQSMVSVSFPLGGYLKKSHLLPGISVKKGEVIAEMEDKSYVELQQEYLVDKAKLEYLAIDLQRQKELSDQEATSKKSYQQVQSEFKSVQIMVKSFEEKLRIIGIDPQKLTVNNISRTVAVRSPITGFVTKVNVNIGKYVNPADVLFELVNPNDIHAALTVFEKDLSRIQKGMKAFVTLANQPNKKYEVEVILVTKNVDEARAGLVHCHFEQPNHELLPGMFLSGEFMENTSKQIAIPEEALVRYSGKDYVFTVKTDSSFELTPVEAGVKQNGLVGVRSAGKDWLAKKIVTKNAFMLLGMLKNKGEDE